MEKTKTRTFVAVVIALIVTCGVLAVGWIGSRNQINSYAGALESGYQKSFSELVSNINDVEVTLSKAMVSTNNSKRQENYQKVNEECMLCANNLSDLPVNHQSIVETTEFVNKLGGFSYYLSQKLKNGNDMTEQDAQSVEELYNWCTYVQKVINDYADSNPNFSITNTSQMGDTNTSFDKMFASTTQTGMDFPTLIYDGPFSKSINDKEYVGLSGSDVTEDEAKKILQNAFADYNIKNLTYTSAVTGNFDGYNFTFDTTHRRYFAQVTKKGGLLMNVSSSGTLSKQVFELEDAELEAQNFARRLGFENMESVWSTELGGVAYVNLTPIVNDTILYPDMIKAKVSLDTGSILGWEALSYASNHTDRKDFDFQVAESTARKAVDARLSILTAKKCIIPVQYGTEQLCYEYKCAYNNYTYYVYISAKSGEEVQILRVIKSSSGNLLQ